MLEAWLPRKMTLCFGPYPAICMSGKAACCNSCGVHAHFEQTLTHNWLSEQSKAPVLRVRKGRNSPESFPVL